MITTTIDNLTRLIGVLEIIKRNGYLEHSRKALFFLDSIFKYECKGTIYVELPKHFIKELNQFFDDYVGIYGDYGSIGAGQIDDSMMDFLKDYEGNIIFNPYEN